MTGLLTGSRPHLHALLRLVAAMVLVLPMLLAAALPAGAQVSPFAGGWTLEPGKSALRFQSVKNETVVESSEFATFTGGIDEDGTATIKVALDSVDTKIDLRNVRMRFLFFESFQFPQAVITARIDRAQLGDLATLRRKVVPLTYTLDLHGIAKEWQADVVVTLLSDDEVVVSTGAPISMPVAAYGLEGGIQKLEEAANVVIVPSATISFDFFFSRNVTAAAVAPATAPAAPAPLPAAPAAQAGAALESQGDFDLAACVGRFEILSRTDNITFGSGRARLQPSSFFLLDSIADIVNRCPGLRIEIAGHTDDVGSDAANLRLSRRRADSVVRYLIGKGVDPNQITSAGYGEARPIFDNSTPENRRRNRRIEFRVLNG